jgi:hypothetical protein
MDEANAKQVQCRPSWGSSDVGASVMKRIEKPELRQQSILFGTQQSEVHSRRKGRQTVLQQDGCGRLQVDVGKNKNGCHNADANLALSEILEASRT